MQLPYRDLRNLPGAMLMHRFWRYRCYYTPFVRLEKGEIRNKDKRELLPAGNIVSRLIPQIVAAEPDEFRILVEQISGWGYREIDLNMGCPFPLIVNRRKGSGYFTFSG